MRPSARPRWAGGTASPITALAVGMMPPPPMPCSARPASKVAKLGASAMSSEPAANSPHTSQIDGAAAVAVAQVGHQRGAGQAEQDEGHHQEPGFPDVEPESQAQHGDGRGDDGGVQRGHEDADEQHRQQAGRHGGVHGRSGGSRGHRRRGRGGEASAAGAVRARRRTKAADSRQRAPSPRPGAPAWARPAAPPSPSRNASPSCRWPCRAGSGGGCHPTPARPCIGNSASAATERLAARTSAIGTSSPGPLPPSPPACR